ncbi:adenylate cyclase [Desulfonatronum thiosulfatophilum]|uniref:Adenylate cyclase n=1 Tax=Desulfonatronum thiosulfatophilum TaxID=617002 RepID=A0A1G6ESJ4_9BACT|nr:adenylate/guanylate cyclase domain-containing protein [Desulfonatronum thiosulfatophilum]SDB60457.1 adenylate cyclase [Desulfonatronum thiosulfatophilum]
MRLSVKLFFGILLIAFMASGATGSYFYFQAKNALLDSIRQQLKATAKMASMLVDGDVLQQLTHPSQMTSPEYFAIQDLMGAIAQSNEEYLYAYTMRLENGQVRFIVDSPAHDDDGDGVFSDDELPEPLGALYPDPPEELIHGFVRPSSDQHPHHDQWGTTMSGYAPILNGSGQPIGLIGIDMSIDRVESKLASIRRAGLVSLGIALLVAVLMGWYFSRRIFQPLVAMQHALARVGEGDYSIQLDESGRDEIAASAKTYNAMARELQEKALMKASLGKVLNTRAMQHLLANRLKLGGEIYPVTVLVCDLRGFSRLSQKLPPKLLVGLLNDYFTVMVEIIQKHGGMVDKFVGDMVLAVFGHPVPLEEEQQAALKAAREMIARCDALNQELHLGHDLLLENSVGLDSGTVLAGNIGSPERMEYTVIGHAVNVAARVERLTRVLDVRLAVSTDFIAAHGDGHNLTNIGPRSLPGMDLTMEVYVEEKEKK